MGKIVLFMLDLTTKLKVLDITIAYVQCLLQMDYPCKKWFHKDYIKKQLKNIRTIYEILSKFYESMKYMVTNVM